MEEKLIASEWEESCRRDVGGRWTGPRAGAPRRLAWKDTAGEQGILPRCSLLTSALATF